MQKVIKNNKQKVRLGMSEGIKTKLKQKRVVVGTIDFKIIQTLGRRFSTSDYDVCYIQRGVNLLIEILDNNVDLLILDLELAGVMGVEVLPVIRRLRPRLPIILISDDFTHRIRKIAAEQGITYQAYKPVSDNESDAIASAAQEIIGRMELISSN